MSACARETNTVVSGLYCPHGSAVTCSDPVWPGIFGCFSHPKVDAVATARTSTFRTYKSTTGFAKRAGLWAHSATMAWHPTTAKSTRHGAMRVRTTWASWPCSWHASWPKSAVGLCRFVTLAILDTQEISGSSRWNSKRPTLWTWLHRWSW